MTVEKKQFWTRILIDLVMMLILLGGAWMKEQSARAVDQYRLDALEKALSEQKNQTTAIVEQNRMIFKTLTTVTTILQMHTGIKVGDSGR